MNRGHQGRPNRRFPIFLNFSFGESKMTKRLENKQPLVTGGSLSIDGGFTA